ncbi:MAG: hypothetical protein IPL78_22915 [Chloroflexi bacterium]|nr:hypothetical protein [Chloroflexota bacterium]
MKNSNCGSQLNGDEQAIYSFINEYEHSGWVPGYYGIACYYEGIDTVVIQFVNTTGEEMELVSNIVYRRIARILHGEINMDE